MLAGRCCPCWVKLHEAGFGGWHGEAKGDGLAAGEARNKQVGQTLQRAVGRGPEKAQSSAKGKRAAHICDWGEQAETGRG